MTTEEFSNEFSVLLNSFGITPNIILDEYEKSVFLTEAQEQIIIEAYTGRSPLYKESFEETEELRSYLAPLVSTYKFQDTDVLDNVQPLTSYSSVFMKPEFLWFITYESAKLEDNRLGCLSGSVVGVIPVTQDELHRTIRNPFRGPGKSRVLRVSGGDSTLELISKYHISEYVVRFLKKPKPLIVTDLPEGLSINNSSNATECTLPEPLHRTILNRAVQLALVAKTQTSK